MSLTEEELFLLRDEIHQAFEKPDDLIAFLNKYENIKGKLVLKINYANLPDDKILANLSIFNQNYEEYKLLIIEASNTQWLNFEGETSGIISQIHNNPCIQYEENNDKVIVKNSFKMQEAIFKKNYQICHIFGHGNNSGIIFTEQEGIETEKLKALLQYQKHYQCFIFNICHSETIAKEVSTYIDYAIGMTQAINDRVAIEFAKGFYLGLKNGIDNNQDIFLRGFREGIQAISGDKNSQYNMPVLYISYKQAILNLLKQLDAENKIDELIKQLYPNFPNNILFRIYSYPIKQPDLLELVKIFKEIKDWNLVQSAYRETLPENATIDNSKLNNPENINNIIDILREKYPFVSGNVPSILEFSKNLAGKFVEDSQEYPRIKFWIEEVSSKLNIQISVNPKVESGLATNPKTFLLLIISPEDNVFRLEVEYILDENKNSQPQPFDFKELLSINFEADDGKGVICSEEKIPSMLEKIINIFLDSFCNKISIPIIEIFSPSKNLDKNIDTEWYINDPYSDDEEKIPILQEYNIILHPIERFQRTKANLNFQEVCKKISELLKNKNNTKSISITEHIQKIDQVDSKNYKKIGIDLRRKKAIGAKINSPLTEKEKEYFWKAIFMGGTPVVFWTRHQNDENINLDAIDCHLTIDCLSNNYEALIEKVYKIRQDACIENNPEDLGYHLGFLCDNPNRIPTVKHLQRKI